MKRVLQFCKEQLAKIMYSCHPVFITGSGTLKSVKARYLNISYAGSRNKCGMTISQQTNWTAKLPKGCEASRRSITRKKALLTTNHNLQAKKGFTLVELAIVIVIIGLLVGGVLQGQELIDQAKIRNQIKQLEEFNSAALIFKSKYNAIPGDITLAQKTMFGFYNAAGSGNGNGVLEDAINIVPNYHAWNEPYFFFINLSEAKLIKNYLRYSSGNYNIGVVFPPAKIGDGGVAAISMRDGIYYFIGPTFKNDTSGAGAFVTISANPTIIPSDAFTLDAKIDDGVPSTGLLRAVILTNSTATNFNNDSTTDNCLGSTNLVYNLSTTQPLCRLVVKSKVD